MDFNNILMAFIWFAVLGGALGVLLAVASKIFAVKTDPRIPKITECLPGANCGGCGFTGCAALAKAIAEGKAKPDACRATGPENVKKIGEICGVKADDTVRMRAQVMCSGTEEYAKKKYIYRGAPDCVSASRMGGGDKLCPNGCIGLGTCASVCRFDAISVVDGVAVVDYDKCTGCGLCTTACPKHIIRLIPYDSRHWVGCLSVDKGPVTRKYCDVGCISCKLCEKNCPDGAISVNDFVASIDYSKCTGCDKCISVCPRKIIWSCDSQGEHLVITGLGK